MLSESMVRACVDCSGAGRMNQMQHRPRRARPQLARAGRALAIAAAMLALPASAWAADYWFLGAGADVYDFVDVSRITPMPDGGQQAWTTRVLEGKGASGRKVKTVLSLTVFYCGQDAARTSRLVQYRGNGALKGDQDLPQARTQPVTPGTVGAAEYDFVCAEPFSRSDKYRDLGDIDPVARADALRRAEHRSR